jgi:hypothetical protein
MSCDIQNGRAYPCKDAIGGIKEVLWVKHSSVDYGAIAAGAVSDVDTAPSTGGSITFYRWELSKNSGSFQQNVQSSVENGTVYYEQVLTIQTPKLSAADNAELAEVLKNRLSIVVRDNNDNYHVMGYATGAEVTGGNFGTGTAKGDLNGYNLVFTAEEKVPAPFGPDFTDSTVVGAFTATTTISPGY